MNASDSRAAHVLPAHRSGIAKGVERLLPYALFAVLPAVVVVTMVVIAVTTGPLAWDFRNELYPQAKTLLDGNNPWPEGLWPPLAMVLAMPFTVLPSEAAGIAFALGGLGCMALALWLVDVRDWRVYGAVGLWPPVLIDIRIAHLTPVLCLLAAVVWRYRDQPLDAGAALGIACGLKFLLWPLGIWLFATYRVRAAITATLVGATAVVLIVPFTAPDEYLRTVHSVADDFDQDSYSLFGMLTQLGSSETAAHVATYAFGAALLILTWRLGSFTLAIAAALVLSPIVWMDFYALAAIPLAIARPKLSWVWFLPLLTWGLPSSGIATTAFWGVGRVLIVFAIVIGVATRAESTALPSTASSR